MRTLRMSVTVGGQGRKSFPVDQLKDFQTNKNEPTKKISEELQESEYSDPEGVYDEPVKKVAVKVVPKVIGEDEWADYDMKKKENVTTVLTSHSRTGSAAGFLPLNHRQQRGEDPNFGWGAASSSDIEMATIVPSSPNLTNPASRRRR